MDIGFGRVVVNAVVLDDPYIAGLDELPRFEVISDAGPRYRVERVDHRRWRIRRAESMPRAKEGAVHRGGNSLNRWYSYKRKGRLLPSGQQNMFINAVFGLIRLLDRDTHAS